jgi:hypothetical protein
MAKDIKDKLDIDASSLIFGAKNKITPKNDVAPVAKVNRTKKKDTGIPQEEHYLNNTDTYLPFSNSIRADQYISLKRLEYHRKQTVRVILEEALDEYLAKQPLTKKKLPEKELPKLKQLKTAQDYKDEKVGK